ncbi:HAD family hydrolase [Bacillus sp. S10(2024)]|uniref:HAD family hydrolase n=1 Tax=Bacillus sp. S10(2024) TaxID=3162886 RepID=UPI003D197861
MLEAIIFDFDGLIVDTEMPEFAAISAIYKEYDMELPIELFQKYIGREYESFDWWSFLERKLSYTIDKEYLNQKKNVHVERLIQKEGIRPGIKHIIKQARNMNIRLAIASSSDKGWVIENLKRINLLDQFELIITGDDVVHKKPSPEIYKLVMSSLNIQSNKIMAFEDSPNGAIAALRAGIPCVVFPNQLTFNCTFPEGVTIYKSLSNVSLEALFETALSVSTAP